MEELVEQLKTIKNLADISVLLIEEGKMDLLPTALELIYMESQQILDEHCVKHNPDK